MPRKKSFITITDQFCGTGGSSAGAMKVSKKMGGGLEIAIALNHWALAIETHNSNFQDTFHECTDISACDPRRYMSTNILITSPECTNQSNANGKKKPKSQLEMFNMAPPKPEEERSRATMWDVPRFAEVHDYELIIVENVVQARSWLMWEAWLKAMHALNYRHKCVYINSMHCHPTPQSRDRMYVVFWKKGNKAPNLDFTPKAYCYSCSKDVAAVQSWKNSRKQWGVYRKNYVYRCPHCAMQVEPYYYSAFNLIDWTIPGKPIFDRVKPLSPNTIKRIETGLKTHGKSAFLIYLEHTKIKHKGTSIFNTMNTQTTTDATGIVTPYIVENNGQSTARDIMKSISTLTTNTTQGFISSKALNGFMTYYNGRFQANSILRDPMGTQATRDRISTVIYPDKENLTLDDLLYRTIRPHEVKKGMAFDDDYIIKGNSSEQVKQLGNAVTPPAMEWLIERGLQTFN